MHYHQLIAKSIRKERVDQTCPEESWGGYVSGMEGEITDAKTDADGNLVLTIWYDQYTMDHEQGTFELVLKPTDWRPRPRPRTSRCVPCPASPPLLEA